jgi:hypothetical protein
MDILKAEIARKRKLLEEQKLMVSLIIKTCYKDTNLKLIRMMAKSSSKEAI